MDLVEAATSSAKIPADHGLDIADGKGGGRQGEERFRKYVSDRLAGYSSFSSFLPGRSEIDLMILGPAGVFAVEVKHWKGRVLLRSHAPCRVIQSGGASEDRDNPIVQARNHAARAADFYRKLFGAIRGRVRALLVFSHPESSIELDLEPEAHAEVFVSEIESVDSLLAKVPKEPVDPNIESYMRAAFTAPGKEFAGMRILSNPPEADHLEFPTFLYLAADDGVALSYLGVGQPPNAVRLYKTTHTMHEKDPWRFWNLAHVFWKGGNLNNALEALDRGRSLVPEDYQIQFLRAQLTISRNTPRVAIGFLEKLHRKDAAGSPEVISTAEMCMQLGAVKIARLWAEEGVRRFGPWTQGLPNLFTRLEMHSKILRRRYSTSLAIIATTACLACGIMIQAPRTILIVAAALGFLATILAGSFRVFDYFFLDVLPRLRTPLPTPCNRQLQGSKTGTIDAR